MVKVDRTNKWRIFGLFLMAIVLLDLTPLGGNSIMYVNAVRCGHIPLQSGTVYKNKVPHYTKTPLFGLFRGYPVYFCSPEEAERAGYSANESVRNYPHLPFEEQRGAIEKSWNVYR